MHAPLQKLARSTDPIIALRARQLLVRLERVATAQRRLPSNFNDLSEETQIQRVAVLQQRILRRAVRSKTAGEVIFRKDMGNDVNNWAYGVYPQSNRAIVPEFNYSPRNLKPLARILRATLAALGFTCSALTSFSKLKSATVSPDGNLGGKGYILKISDMRRQFINCLEALSSLSDTLYDEVNAPHWALMSRQESPDDRNEMKELLHHVDEIKKDPEEWADDELEQDQAERVESA